MYSLSQMNGHRIQKRIWVRIKSTAKETEHFHTTIKKKKKKKPQPQRTTQTRTTQTTTKQDKTKKQQNYHLLFQMHNGEY